VSPLADTSASAREVQLAAYRQMSPTRRVALAFEMSEDALALTLAGIRARHPDWTDADVAAEGRTVLLGFDLAASIRPPPSRR
jgi:hypothetical protein